MIKSLSSLRFFFAIMVFVVHLGFFHVAIGHAFFIILSGFILSHVYGDKVLQKKITYRDFFSKRLLRIYPLHIITLLIAIPLSMDGVYEKTVKWFTIFFLNLFSLQTFVPNNFYYFSFNGVAWNAADLIVFYACFPFLILLFSKINIKLYAIFILFCIVFIILLMVLLPEKYHTYLFYICPFFRIADFILGMFLYRLVKKIATSPSYKIASILEISTIIVVILFYCLAVYNLELVTPFVHSVYLWLPLSLLILVFYFDAGIISKKLLSSRVMLFLGGLSYSFYMIHQLVIRYAELINKKYYNIEVNALYYTACFCITLLLAYLSNKYFERLFYKNK